MTRQGGTLNLASRLLLIAAVGCAGGEPEADLHEATLAWAFANAETDLDPPAAYCVLVRSDIGAEAEDPDPDLLARFADQSIPVRPGSECSFGDGERHNVRDEATGRYGLLFVVGPVMELDGSQARVRVEYLQGGLWGRGWECHLEDGADGWEVTECKRIFDV